MKTKNLLYIWGAMFIVCACLGFIPAPEGLLKAVCVLAAAGFFVAPGMLLYRFYKDRDRTALGKLAWVAAGSLGATLALLLGSVLAVGAPSWVGDVLYGLLVIVSSPMVCSRFWAATLFGWACVLMVAITAKKSVK